MAAEGDWRWLGTAWRSPLLLYISSTSWSYSFTLTLKFKKECHLLPIITMEPWRRAGVETILKNTFFESKRKTYYRDRSYGVKTVGAWVVAATAKPTRPPYAIEAKRRVVPGRAIPHSSQKFRHIFIILGPGLFPIFSFSSHCAPLF